MSDTRLKLNQIKNAIKESSREYLDFDKTKVEFLAWLSQFRFPKYPESSNWEECLESFPDSSPECKKPTDGLKIRFLLKLFTSNHTYIISIVECFDIDAQSIGIISVHVNIDQNEYLTQKAIELTYKQAFDSSLKPKQTIFVSPFNIETLTDSLNEMGLAILSNELTGQTSHKKLPTIKHNIPQQVSFPETD